MTSQSLLPAWDGPCPTWTTFTAVSVKGTETSTTYKGFSRNKKPLGSFLHTVTHWRHSWMGSCTQETFLYQCREDFSLRPYSPNNFCTAFLAHNSTATLNFPVFCSLNTLFFCPTCFCFHCSCLRIITHATGSTPNINYLQIFSAKEISLLLFNLASYKFSGQGYNATRLFAKISKKGLQPNC